MYLHSENAIILNTIEIVLDKTKQAKAYMEKFRALRKIGNTIKEAEEKLKQPIEFEVYIDNATGSIFMVEAEAVENVDICNPYQENDTLQDVYNTEDEYYTEVMIDEINQIVSALGDFSFGEIELEASPLFGENETSISLVEGIGLDTIKIVTYDKNTDEEISEINFKLENVERELLLELYDIAYIWLEQNKE